MTRHAAVNGETGAGFHPTIEQIDFVGAGLNRPECVLATAAGSLFTCDWRRGIAETLPGGGVNLIGSDKLIADGFRPNGIALRRDGSFLFANLGAAGGVWQLTRNGVLAPFLTEVDGVTLPAVNFVLIDDEERVWISVSTLHRDHKLTATRDDGIIVLADRRGARIVADGLIWTNETRVSPDRRHLWVNETFVGRTTRFRLAGDGSLSDRETVAEYPRGTFPDGLAFDVTGAVWIVCVVTNRLIRVAPDLSHQIVLEDFDPAHLDAVMAALEADDLTRDLVYRNTGRRMLNHSSLAFGGPDLRTLYLGSISGDRIARLAMPIAGVPPSHWRWG
jgi:sugar lactone lactonase YvrE